MRTVNPATGQTIAEYDEHTDAEIDAILGAAAAAQGRWQAQPPEHRVQRLREIAALLRDDARKRRLAELMTTEMGKPIGQAIAEVEKCAWMCEYYADNAQQMLAAPSVDVGGDDASSTICRSGWF